MQLKIIEQLRHCILHQHGMIKMTRHFKNGFFFLLTLVLPICLNAQMIFVPYDEGFAPSPCDLDDFGMLFIPYYESYEQHYKNCILEEYLIPPLIHFIWLGSELPEEASKMVETWKNLNPNWVVKVWTDKDVPSFGLKNQAAYDHAVNFGEKSDIFRYEILYRFGGTYVDTDFECLNSFDSLHQSCEFYTGMNRDKNTLLNGLIGTKPGHPIIKACIDNIEIGRGDNDKIRIMHQTGPYFFTDMFFSFAPDPELGTIALLPPTYFYPFPAGDLENHYRSTEERRQFARPESLAIHYWRRSWQR